MPLPKKKSVLHVNADITQFKRGMMDMSQHYMDHRYFNADASSEWLMVDSWPLRFIWVVNGNVIHFMSRFFHATANI